MRLRHGSANGGFQIPAKRRRALRPPVGRPAPTDGRRADHRCREYDADRNDRRRSQSPVRTDVFSETATHRRDAYPLPLRPVIGTGHHVRCSDPGRSASLRTSRSGQYVRISADRNHREHHRHRLPYLRSVLLPALTDAGSLEITGCPAIETLSFPKAERFDGDVSLATLPAIKDFGEFLPALKAISGDLSIDDLSSLEGVLDLSGCTFLRTVRSTCVWSPRRD